jgi:hypothetical protein
LAAKVPFFGWAEPQKKMHVNSVALTISPTKVARPALFNDLLKLVSVDLDQTLVSDKLNSFPV